jgi:tripartite-type tricarboxylate transporter receptor subunit TctC
MHRRMVLASPALLVAAQAGAQTLSGRTLQLIVPYPPGGGNDIGARALAPLLERELGVSVVVVNRAGASSQLGMAQVARAAPDGLTIGYGLWPQTTTLFLDPSRQAPFTRDSFTPLCIHAVDPGAILVKADSPLRSLADMIAVARARPDDFRMTDNGTFGHEHLAAVQLQRLAGVRFNQVHFQGAGPATIALLSGQTEAGIFAVGTANSNVRQGLMRAIAVLSRTESPFLPGVATAGAQGFDIVAGSTRAFVAPAGLPAGVKQALAGGLERAILSPEHAEKMQQLAIPIAYQGPDDFARYWQQEETTLRPLMEELLKEGAN